MSEEEQYYEESDWNEQPAPKRKRRRKRRPLGKRISELFPQKGDDFFEILRKLTFLLSSAVFLVCIFLIGKYFWENYQNSVVTQATQEIHDQVPEPVPETEETKEDEEERFRLLGSAKRLLAENKDIIGYISIPNEPKIAYPVLQRKNSEDGNVYYLDKNIYLEYARAGSIFMDYRNSFDEMTEHLNEEGKPDGTYVRASENSDNLIIYGHNMHDYSMFGALKYYTNDETYYDAHPIVELESNYVKYKYKIFAMIIVDVEDDTETQFDYWNWVNFKDEQEFYDYVNEIKRRTIRLTDVDVKYGDKILTLSTCNSTFSDGRLVVFGRLLREGEKLREGCTSTANPNIKWCNSYYKWHKNTYNPDAEFVPYG